MAGSNPVSSDPQPAAAAVGRLAPSPTGALHLGNARTFLAVWLAARLTGSRLVFRIEDLDGPRVKPWAVDQARQDLEFLGLDWDTEAPRQTDRGERYAGVLRELWRRGLLYPCVCSRKEAAAAASAPHAGEMGIPYPGTCRDRWPLEFSQPPSAAELAAWHTPEAASRPAVLRLRLPDAPAAVSFQDGLAGAQTFQPRELTGDFVVARQWTQPAYQLAVILDDADQGVTQVIRGDDLLSSTALQIHLQELLGLPRPQYWHLPLVVGADGRRLAKRHGDTRLSWFREQGVGGAQVVGFLAWRSGWIDRNEALNPTALLAQLQPGRPDEDPLAKLFGRLSRAPLVLTAEEARGALRKTNPY